MRYTCVVLVVSQPLDVVQLCLSEGNHHPFLIPLDCFDQLPKIGTVVELTEAQISKIRYQRIHTYILMDQVAETDDLWRIKGVSITTGEHQYFDFLKTALVSYSDLIGKQVQQINTYA